MTGKLIWLSTSLHSWTTPVLTVLHGEYYMILLTNYQVPSLSMTCIALIDGDNDCLSPSIGFEVTDRLCGDGPQLQFLFDIDEKYKSTAEKILNYFNTNFDAVSQYLRRIEYVYDIYKENTDLDRRVIENETSKII